MSTITKGEGGPPKKKDSPKESDKSVSEGAKGEESHGGYGGTDRLRSETGPLEGSK